MKYRKKPIDIEAFQFGKDEFPFWFSCRLGKNNIIVKEDCVYIKTLEGTMKADLFDYIIKGIEGEIYPCKPDIFEKSYDKID